MAQERSTTYPSKEQALLRKGEAGPARDAWDARLAEQRQASGGTK